MSFLANTLALSLYLAITVTLIIIYHSLSENLNQQFLESNFDGDIKTKSVDFVFTLSISAA